MSTLLGLAALTTSLAYLDAKHSIGEDLTKIRGLIDVKRSLTKSNKEDKNSIYYYFEKNLISRGNEECYVCEGLSLTWNQVFEQSNQFAHFLLSQGIERKNGVSLLMDNKPHFIIIWLACLSIDCLPSFINYNLVGDGLAHCVATSKSSMLIYDTTFTSNVSDVVSSLLTTNPNLKLVSFKDQFSTSTSTSIIIPNSIPTSPKSLLIYPITKIPNSYRSGIAWSTPGFLIFTSGTTGHPKAAIVTHGRSATGMIMWTRLNGFSSKTRIYTVCPLYHSTAAILAIAVAWNAGSTVIIGRKFSSSNFWNEARQHKATTIQYVGEILRYLLTKPPAENDKDHSVTMAYGNGLRPDIWEAFRDRYGVTTISEFFASSEGNGSTFNKNSSNALGVGAVGHEGTISAFARRKDQIIVKLDLETEEPVRNKDGLCIRASPNEDGELLCRIVENSPYQAFSGYYGNESATQKKIIKNVLVLGDTYFRTGDLLRKYEGYYYFSDRLGDTFRWKGENVATTQIAGVLGGVLTAAQEPNVYGVLVPSNDGRAGCAAIPGGILTSIELDSLANHVIKELPNYARPLFLRFVESNSANGTNKQLKVQLRNEGVDPNVVKDPIFWLKDGKYIKFNKLDWENLKNGSVKL